MTPRLAFCEECGSPEERRTEWGVIPPFVVDLDAGEGHCSECKLKALATRPADPHPTSQARNSYLAVLEGVRLTAQNIDRHTLVRCKECGYIAAWLTLVEGNLLLHRLPDIGGLENMDEDKLPTTLPGAAAGQPRRPRLPLALRDEAWLLGYPEAITGTISLTCSTHGELSWRLAGLRTAAANHADAVRLAPIHQSPVASR